jgi:hypothetical protein
MSAPSTPTIEKKSGSIGEHIADHVPLPLNLDHPLADLQVLATDVDVSKIDEIVDEHAQHSFEVAQELFKKAQVVIQQMKSYDASIKEKLHKMQ